MCGKAFILTGVKKAAPGPVSTSAWQVGKQKPGGHVATVWRTFFFVEGFELLGSDLNRSFCPSVDSSHNCVSKSEEISYARKPLFFYEEITF